MNEKILCQRCNYEYDKNKMIYVEDGYHDYFIDEYYDVYVCKDCFHDGDIIINDKQ